MSMLSILMAMLFSVGPQVIIPKPVDVSTSPGSFVYTSETQIKTRVADRKFARETVGLPEYSRNAAYRLTIGKKGIEIIANTETGIFYARQDLSQMKAVSDTLQFCTITDWPRFGYRGMMLDVAGLFYGKDYILKQMEAMSLLKMNVLHLHLTDNNGWRIEVDRYPELFKDNSGYLTKGDCCEIVARAAELHIEVIPEIDFPGHNREVLNIFPDLACEDAEGNKVMNGDLCPSNPAVYEFYENVLDEVMELFPSRMIHIGGDEAYRSGWRTCPHCRNLMKKEGFTDVAQLQSHMTHRFAEFLRSKGRTLLGWDEIAQGGLAPGAAVMIRESNPDLDMMEKGHDVIMGDAARCFFVFPQDAPFMVPEAFGSYLPLSVVYAYNPQDPSIKPEYMHHMLGVESCIWYENITSADHSEYMIYPRTFAIAEIGWTPQDKREYVDFKERVILLSELFKSKGYNCFDIRNEYGDRYEATHPVRHLAVGKKVYFAEGCHWDTVWYPSTGESALTDGRFGTWAFKDGIWQRYYCDIDVTIDLEEIQPIHYIGATFFSQRIHSQAFPVKVEMFVSKDGENFEKCGESTYRMRDSAQVSGDFMDFGAPVNAEARYVRYVARRDPAPGHSCLMLDEIVIN